MCKEFLLILYCFLYSTHFLVYRTLAVFIHDPRVVVPIFMYTSCFCYKCLCSILSHLNALV